MEIRYLDAASARGANPFTGKFTWRLDLLGLLHCGGSHSIWVRESAFEYSVVFAWWHFSTFGFAANLPLGN